MVQSFFFKDTLGVVSPNVNYNAEKRRKKRPSDAAAAEEELFRLPAAEPAEVEAEAEGCMINIV